MATIKINRRGEDKTGREKSRQGEVLSARCEKL